MSPAPLGRVYVWNPDPDPASGKGGHLTLADVALPNLSGDGTALVGRYVEVRNGAEMYEEDQPAVRATAAPLGNARADMAGNFCFDHGRGGGRIDKSFGTPAFRTRYIASARFGEVNTYFHVDRIAAYVDELLRELGAPSLPRVIAIVNAHHGATELAGGVRDGRMLRGRWRPFQGGHYRLPSRRYDLVEHHPIAPTGEIHLGPGRKTLTHGALVDLAGSTYRANAAHNPGIIYHEYGHHVTQHTADFRGNALRRPERQNNRKTAMDEGTCDYLTAVMLASPHIWACHRQHDDLVRHPRSLASRKTMADFDPSPNADPHANGTIWGAALWDLRRRLAVSDPAGARGADLLLLEALRTIGRQGLTEPAPTVRSVRASRESFAVGLEALRAADRALTGGRRREAIDVCFEARGIRSIDGAAARVKVAAAR